jgi:ketosteroid isomerase-like protein
MNKIVLVFTALLFCNIGLHAQKKDNKLRLEKELQDDHKRLETFYKKAMVDSLAAMYTPKCYFIRDFSERIDSQDDVKRKFNSDYRAGFKVLNLTYTPDDYKVYGDIVLEVGVLNIKYIDPKSKATLNEDYNYTMIWKAMTGGGYRIRSEQWGITTNPCK